MLLLDVLNKSKLGIKLNDTETYINNNINRPPLIDINTIFNMLLENYAKK